MKSHLMNCRKTTIFCVLTLNVLSCIGCYQSEESLVPKSNGTIQSKSVEPTKLSEAVKAFLRDKKDLLEFEPYRRIASSAKYFRETCDQVIAEDPNHAEAYQVRAECLWMLGDITNAYQDIEKSLKLKQSSAAFVTRAKLKIAKGYPFYDTYRPPRPGQEPVASNLVAVQKDLDAAGPLNADASRLTQELKLADLKGFKGLMQKAFADPQDIEGWVRLASQKFSVAESYEMFPARRTRSSRTFGGGIRGRIPISDEQSLFLYRSVLRDVQFVLMVDREHTEASYLQAKCIGQRGDLEWELSLLKKLQEKTNSVSWNRKINAAIEHAEEMLELRERLRASSKTRSVEEIQRDAEIRQQVDDELFYREWKSRQRNR